MPDQISQLAEMVRVDQLHDHPRNYRSHPQDQIDHLAASIKEHGFYKNVVAARDMTILAGHGAVKAARQVGLSEIPVVVLPISPTSREAMKIMIGDNEIDHLAEQDDRLLTDLLKEIKDESPDSLLGTGYDDMMLANLAFVTRPASEIADHNEAAHWVGLPDYDDGTTGIKIVVNFQNTDDRAAFLKMLEIEIGPTNKSIWWPPRQLDDTVNVRFGA